MFYWFCTRSKCLRGLQHWKWSCSSRLTAICSFSTECGAEFESFQRVWLICKHKKTKPVSNIRKCPVCDFYLRLLRCVCSGRDVAFDASLSERDWWTSFSSLIEEKGLECLASLRLLKEGVPHLNTQRMCWIIKSSSLQLNQSQL